VPGLARTPRTSETTNPTKVTRRITISCLLW
jgi:hypothetical protein